MESRFRFDYDEEYDILYIYNAERDVEESVEVQYNIFRDLNTLLNISLSIINIQDVILFIIIKPKSAFHAIPIRFIYLNLFLRYLIKVLLPIGNAVIMISLLSENVNT